MAAILAGLLSSNFETTQCKNHFEANVVKIHSAVIEILSFSCSVLFLVRANGDHLGMPNYKNKKGYIKETFWHQVGSISTNGS